MARHLQYNTDAENVKNMFQSFQIVHKTEENIHDPCIIMKKTHRMCEQFPRTVDKTGGMCYHIGAHRFIDRPYHEVNMYE